MVFRKDVVLRVANFKKIESVSFPTIQSWLMSSQHAIVPLLLQAGHHSPTANYILYYNLKSDIKQNLLSASACALRSCLMYEGFEISFDNLLKIPKICTPSQIMYYQIALKLHKLMNNHNVKGS